MLLETVVIGALQFRRHALGMVRHGHPQSADSEPVEQLRKAHMAVRHRNSTGAGRPGPGAVLGGRKPERVHRVVLGIGRGTGLVKVRRSPCKLVIADRFGRRRSGRNRPEPRETNRSRQSLALPLTRPGRREIRGCSASPFPIRRAERCGWCRGWRAYAPNGPSIERRVPSCVRRFSLADEKKAPHRQMESGTGPQRISPDGGNAPKLEEPLKEPTS